MLPTWNKVSQREKKVMLNDRISIIQKKRKDELHVLQGQRIHTPSLFCSVTHHNLPVMSESCILYMLACSEHRYTRCAQTIKRSIGPNGCRLYCLINIKRRYAVLKGRRERDIVRPTAPVQIAPVTDRYHVVFRKLF